MVSSILIKDVQIVNEGKVIESDLRIKDQRISHIDKEIKASPQNQIVHRFSSRILNTWVNGQTVFDGHQILHSNKPMRLTFNR